MNTHLHRDQMVIYQTRSGPVLAKVTRLHRDKTITVQAFHHLNQDGKPDGCFLGYTYRTDAGDLRAA